MRTATASDSLVAMSADAAATLAGISHRLLDRWAEQDVVRPAVARRLSPRREIRLYAFDDLLALLVAAGLREHVHERYLREIVARLREHDSPPQELELVIEDGPVHVRLTVDLRPLRARIRSAGQRPATLAGRVESRRGRLGGRAVLAGTRVPVETVRRYLAHGFSPGDIVKAYPSLTLEDVEAARPA